MVAMYYNLGYRSSNVRPCWKCHALGLLLFTNDVELKGQCVGMEAMQFRWFHWQWNHNETKGLRGFTLHAVDSSIDTMIAVRRHTRSTWKTTKEYRRMEQTYLCFNETFVKRRKLRALTRVKVFDMRWKDRVKRWYACQQWASSGDALISNHHRCSLANIINDWKRFYILLFITVYYYWIRVYHRITCGLYWLRNKLKRLHVDKQYRRIVPLML